MERIGCWSLEGNIAVRVRKCDERRSREHAPHEDTKSGLNHRPTQWDATGSARSQTYKRAAATLYMTMNDSSFSMVLPGLKTSARVGEHEQEVVDNFNYVLGL